MRDRNLLILVLLVLGLGAFIWLFERHQPTTEEAREKAETVFGGLEANEVRTVGLANPAGNTTIERGPDGWRLSEPILFAADGPAVDRFLDAVLGLKVERTLGPDEVNPADYRLNEPEYRVRLVTKGGEEHVLAIGSNTALGSKRAVSLGDGDIILASGSFADALDKRLDDWRSRSLADLTLSELATITVLRDGDRIEAVSLPEGWRLLSPLEDRADEELLRNVTADLNAVRIEEFLDDGAGADDLGLSPPRLEVTLIPVDGGSATTLDFGIPREYEGATHVACRRNGSDLFWVSDRAETGLAKAPVRWREPKVFPFKTWDVEGLEITAGEKSALLSRSEGRWVFTDDRAEADSEAVRSRLSALAGMEATNFDLVDLAQPEMGRVTVRVSRTPSGGTNPIVFVFSEPMGVGGDVLVTVSDRSTVMSVRPEDVAAVIGDLEALRAVANQATPTEDLG